MSEPTIAEIIARLAIQKSSQEMDDEKIAGADWQDGFDYLLADARAIIAIHKALVAALKEIAREQSAKTATEAADRFQNIARAALKAVGES